jgi:hypothetical protein
MHVRGLRQPRVALALTLAVVSVGVFSSSVGIGALPTSTLPVYGVTDGDGSRATVAELGDTNGDGIGDYAVGLPDANAGSGVVYVFLGHPGALSPTPTGLDLAAASFTITGHGGEMLGYAIAGDDVNGDGLSDIAIGAPAAGAPSKADGGAVYVAFGSRQPQNLASTQLYPAGYTNNPGAPATPSAYGSRYDSFGVSAHTGMSLAALPDVNGDGYRDIAVGSPDTSIHRPGEGNVAVLYGKPRGVHINLSDLWEAGYPYYFHIDFPALDDQHVGESVASVGDVTGDGWPDLAIAAPQADNNGLADSGSVWIISGHLPPIDAGCSMHMVDNSCPWLRLKNLTAAQGYRIDGAHAGDGLGSSLAGVGDQNADGIADLAIGASAASPGGRSHAGEVVVVQGQHNLTVRNLATAPPLETFSGARAGDGLGASLAAAADVDGDGHIDMVAGSPGASSFAGTASLLHGLPGANVDLAGAGTGIAPAGPGAQTGSAVAAGSSLDGGDVDTLVSAPGIRGAFVVGGSNPPPLAQPAPPPAATPAAGAPTAPGKAAAHKKKPKKLRLCPLTKPKPRYHTVKGKRVKVKPKPCRPLTARQRAVLRAKAKAKAKAKALTRAKAKTKAAAK